MIALLANKRAAVNLRASDGSTALMAAVEADNFTNVKYLLHIKAEPCIPRSILKRQIGDGTERMRSIETLPLHRAIHLNLPHIASLIQEVSDSKGGDATPYSNVVAPRRFSVSRFWQSNRRAQQARKKEEEKKRKKFIQGPNGFQSRQFSLEAAGFPIPIWRNPGFLSDALEPYDNPPPSIQHGHPQESLQVVAHVLQRLIHSPLFVGPELGSGLCSGLGSGVGTELDSERNREVGNLLEEVRKSAEISRKLQLPYSIDDVEGYIERVRVAIDNMQLGERLVLVGRISHDEYSLTIILEKLSKKRSKNPLPDTVLKNCKVSRRAAYEAYSYLMRARDVEIEDWGEKNEEELEREIPQSRYRVTLCDVGRGAKAFHLWSETPPPELVQCQNCLIWDNVTSSRFSDAFLAAVFSCGVKGSMVSLEDVYQNIFITLSNKPLQSIARTSLTFKTSIFTTPKVSGSSTYSNLVEGLKIMLIGEGLSVSQAEKFDALFKVESIRMVLEDLSMVSYLESWEHAVISAAVKQASGAVAQMCRGNTNDKLPPPSRRLLRLIQYTLSFAQQKANSLLERPSFAHPENLGEISQDRHRGLELSTGDLEWTISPIVRIPGDPNEEKGIAERNKEGETEGEQSTEKTSNSTWYIGSAFFSNPWIFPLTNSCSLLACRNALKIALRTLQNLSGVRDSFSLPVIFLLLTKKLPVPLPANKVTATWVCVWRERQEYGHQREMLNMISRLSEYISMLYVRGQIDQPLSSLLSAQLFTLYDVTIRTLPLDTSSPLSALITKSNSGFHVGGMHSLVERSTRNRSVTCGELGVLRSRVLGYLRAVENMYPIEVFDERMDGKGVSMLRKHITLSQPAEDWNDFPPLISQWKQFSALTRVLLGAARIIEMDSDSAPRGKSNHLEDTNKCRVEFREEKGRQIMSFLGRVIDRFILHPSKSNYLEPNISEPTREPSPTEPRFYKPALVSEVDIVHSADLPEISRHLPPRDTEDLLRFLTVPYLRVGLVLGFFASEERAPALTSSKVQELISACVFEPGPYSSLTQAIPEHIPIHESKKDALLGTPFGYLANELTYNPRHVCDSLMRILQFSLNLTEASKTPLRTSPFLFALRLCKRVETYIMCMLSLDPDDEEITKRISDLGKHVEMKREIPASLRRNDRQIVPKLFAGGNIVGRQFMTEFVMAWRKVLNDRGGFILARWLDLARGDLGLLHFLHTHIAFLFPPPFNKSHASLTEKLISSVYQSAFFRSTHSQLTEKNNMKSNTSQLAQPLQHECLITEAEFLNSMQAFRPRALEWIRGQSKGVRDRVLDSILTICTYGAYPPGGRGGDVEWVEESLTSSSRKPDRMGCERKLNSGVGIFRLVEKYPFEERKSEEGRNGGVGLEVGAVRKVESLAEMRELIKGTGNNVLLVVMFYDRVTAQGRLSINLAYDINRQCQPENLNEKTQCSGVLRRRLMVCIVGCCIEDPRKRVIAATTAGVFRSPSAAFFSSGDLLTTIPSPCPEHLQILTRNLLARSNSFPKSICDQGSQLRVIVDFNFLTLTAKSLRVKPLEPKIRFSEVVVSLFPLTVSDELPQNSEEFSKTPEKKVNMVLVTEDLKAIRGGLRTFTVVGQHTQIHVSPFPSPSTNPHKLLPPSPCSTHWQPYAAPAWAKCAEQFQDISKVRPTSDTISPESLPPWLKRMNKRLENLLSDYEILSWWLRNSNVDLSSSHLNTCLIRVRCRRKSDKDKEEGFKDVFLSKRLDTIHIYDLKRIGRIWMRRQVYASNFGLSLCNKDWIYGKHRDQLTKGADVKIEISREVGLHRHQVYVPSSSLEGCLPDALLQSHHFWRDLGSGTFFRGSGTQGSAVIGSEEKCHDSVTTAEKYSLDRPSKNEFLAQRHKNIGSEARGGGATGGLRGIMMIWGERRRDLNPRFHMDYDIEIEISDTSRATIRKVPTRPSSSSLRKGSMAKILDETQDSGSSKAKEARSVLVDLVMAEGEGVETLAKILSRLDRLPYILPWASHPTLTLTHIHLPRKHLNLTPCSAQNLNNHPKFPQYLRVRELGDWILDPNLNPPLNSARREFLIFRRILREIPHSVLLTRRGGGKEELFEYRLLVAWVPIRRKGLRDSRGVLHVNGGEVEAVHDDEVWNSKLDTRYLIYPIHPTGTLTCTSLASTLYMLALHIGTRQYGPAFKLISTFPNDSRLTKAQLQTFRMVEDLLDSDEHHPDALACHLRLHLDLEGSPLFELTRREQVEHPEKGKNDSENLPQEHPRICNLKSMFEKYLHRRRYVSYQCRLSEQEEIQIIKIIEKSNPFALKETIERWRRLLLFGILSCRKNIFLRTPKSNFPDFNWEGSFPPSKPPIPSESTSIYPRDLDFSSAIAIIEGRKDANWLDILRLFQGETVFRVGKRGTPCGFSLARLLLVKIFNRPQVPKNEHKEDILSTSNSSLYTYPIVLWSLYIHGEALARALPYYYSGPRLRAHSPPPHVTKRRNKRGLVGEEGKTERFDEYLTRFERDDAGEGLERFVACFDRFYYPSAHTQVTGRGNFSLGQLDGNGLERWGVLSVKFLNSADAKKHVSFCVRVHLSPDPIPHRIPTPPKPEVTQVKKRTRQSKNINQDSSLLNKESEFREPVFSGFRITVHSGVRNGILVEMTGHNLPGTPKDRSSVVCEKLTRDGARVSKGDGSGYRDFEVQTLLKHGAIRRDRENTFWVRGDQTSFEFGAGRVIGQRVFARYQHSSSNELIPSDGACYVDIDFCGFEGKAIMQATNDAKAKMFSREDMMSVVKSLPISLQLLITACPYPGFMQKEMNMKKERTKWRERESEEVLVNLAEIRGRGTVREKDRVRREVALRPLRREMQRVQIRIGELREKKAGLEDTYDRLTNRITSRAMRRRSEIEVQKERKVKRSEVLILAEQKKTKFEIDLEELEEQLEFTSINSPLRQRLLQEISQLENQRRDFEREMTQEEKLWKHQQEKDEGIERDIKSQDQKDSSLRSNLTAQIEKMDKILDIEDRKRTELKLKLAPLEEQTREAEEESKVDASLEAEWLAFQRWQGEKEKLKKY